jgi:hypothetical protein
MNDPYAFTNSNEMGEVVGPQPRTYARHALLDEQGKVIPIGPDPIPLDVWRYVIDLETKKPTGTIKRERMRTLGEVFADLYKKLDVVICEKCKHERPRAPEDCCAIHEGCGGEYFWFIDEYFHGPFNESEARQPVPCNFRWVACYPVTGTSEGHYTHIDFVVPEGESCKLVRLALGKTFRGMDHAAEMARRCAILLGA